MLSTSGIVPRMRFVITANRCYFDVVKEFIYLGTAINTNNDVSLEIKRIVTLANNETSLVRQGNHPTRASL